MKLLKKSNKPLFKGEKEKEDYAKFGLIFDSFASIEFQIDEILALFFGTAGVNSFVEHVDSALSFNSKLKLFRVLISIQEVKDHIKLSKQDLKFIENFKQLRNLLAHGMYCPRDITGNFSIISDSKSRYFNLSNLNIIKNIKEKSFEISDKILKTILYFAENKEKLPQVPMLEDVNYLEGVFNF